MDTAGAGSYRPQTRWCGALPYAAEPAREPAAGRPGEVRGRAASAGDVLLAQLRRELQRGHWRVALRHFLMLQAYGYEVPPAERRRCLERAQGCAGREWRKIEEDVAAWAQCLRRART